MRITSIKKLKHNIYELTIDDQEKFKLVEDYLLEYHLLKTKDITDEEYQLLKTLANYSKIYAKTLNYLSYKMRTEGEIIQYLEENECAKPLQVEIINKLKRLNYINDEHYCNMYIKQQFELNKKGPRLIAKELKDKHVDETIIEKALSTISKKMIKENIISVIKYYEKITKQKTLSQLKAKILRSLTQKGYDYEDILSELNSYEFKDDNQADLIKKEFQKVFQKYQKKYQGYELKSRIIRSLMNKGFDYETILSQFDSINLED
ncbi:MAG: hypothetical protein GX490_04935 [Bacilli bacterium]|nr:hypothetical protein [Bacilli bacterium]